MRLGNALPTGKALPRCSIAIVWAVTLSMLVLAQSAPSGTPKSYKIEVPGTQQWVDTKIDDYARVGNK